MMFDLRVARSATVLVVLFAVLLSFLSASAQTASEILVNYVEVSQVDDGLGLTIYFTAIDPSGRANASATVRSASVLIDEGNPTRYEASSDKPDTPLFIALVLDASGSMLGAASDMRAAAMQAVNDAPPRAQFAVIGFNDEITLLTNGFTTDKQIVIDAIQQVQAINNRGTCLYDATYQAVEMLAQAAPLGRRAAIVFTDGVDEVVDPTVGPCSTHTSGNVIDLATRSDLRVPIHTIGMRSGTQARINEIDLKNIASATGGLSAIGDQSDLGDLFRTSMAAIGSQQRAMAIVHPNEGLRTLTLLVTLTDGTPLRAVATFQSPADYSLAETTPTPDLAAMPKPVQLEILGIRPIVEDRVLIVQMNVENEESVSTYRIELKNASTNTLQGDGFIVQPPLASSVSLEVGGLPGGQYEIIMRALDSNGRIVASSTAERFIYPLPTPTPSPTLPTNTPVPLGAKIQSVQLSPTENALRVYMSIYGADSIARLRIELFDQTTHQLIGSPHFSEPAEVAEINAETLTGGNYEVAVVSVDDSGNELARHVYEFSVMPQTPTPMPTAMPTEATNTPAPVGARIQSVQHILGDNVFRLNMAISGIDQIAQFRIEFFDQSTRQLIGTPYFVEPAETAEIVASDLVDGSYEVVVVSVDAAGNELGRDAYEFIIEQPIATPTPSVSAKLGFPRVDDTALELVFPVTTENEGVIAEYILEFIDQDNMLANSFSFSPPPYDELRVAYTTGEIEEGQYTVQLKGLDANKAQVSDSTLQIIINLPPPPPEGGPAASSAAPAAFPSLDWARENQPIALAVIGGLILLLLLALIVIVRRPKPAAHAQFYDELTSAQQVSEIGQHFWEAEADPNATNPYVQMDPDATNPIPRLLLPDARLVVERTRSNSLAGQTIPVDHVPFKLGRRGRGDINLDEDDNVSREHAIIHFENGTFTLTDLGSMHGTSLNGERLSSQTATPLKNGDKIRLGFTTQIVFETEI